MSAVDYYGRLLEDEPRIQAFRAAIEATVRQGDRVLDLGTGLGTFAFFAAQAGAGRVWGVEREAIVHVAETLAVANGLDDRVEFLRGEVLDLEIPEPVDLLIYEDFPVGLLDRRAHRLLVRVQTDLLAEDARMLPVGARLCMAPVQSAEASEGLLPRAVREARGFDLDWSALRPFLYNTPRRASLKPGWLLGVPARGPVLSLLPAPDAADLTVEGHWEAATAGTVHGLALWFDLEVYRDNWITNQPGPRSSAWGQLFLPLEAPVDVRPGQRLQARVARETLEGGTPGWLTWEASVGGQTRKGHELRGLALGPVDLLDGSVRDGER